MKNDRKLGIIRSVNPGRGFGIIEPQHMYSSESLFFHQNDLLGGTIGEMKQGDWVDFVEGPMRRGRKSAVEVKSASPRMEDKIDRQIEKYETVPSMRKGVNPRSQRLDGLTSDEARKLRRHGQMDDSDYFGNMSVNGLMSIYRNCQREDLTEREILMRSMVESVLKDRGLIE